MFTLDWEEDTPSNPKDHNSQQHVNGQPRVGTNGSDIVAVPLSKTSSTQGPRAVNGTSVAIDHAIVSAKLEAHANRSKKKKGLRHVAPADKVTRGFHTPPLSMGEDSDSSACGTPMLRSVSKSSTGVAGSPSLRPSNLTRAFSGLKLDTAPMDIGTPRLRPTDASDSSSTPDHRADSPPQMQGTYELPITRDFASPDSQPKPLNAVVEGGLRRDSPHRKMTAADFQPLKCLGKGAFGTVLLVKQHSTGRLFAQKQLKKASLKIEKRLVDQAKTERAILESVNRHPFVVKLFYAFQDQQKLYLILEYAQGGELFHHLAMERVFTEETAAFYMAQMCLALDHLHRNLGVVYRDLKPENCLLDAEGHLLLTDFGLSKVAVDEQSEDGAAGDQCTSIVGTIDYMAPEAVQGKPYDAAVDWWSLGALGYDLLTGSPPFSAPNRKKTEQKIVHGKVTPPYYLSPDAKDLLARLLRKEPRKRLGGNMPKDFTTIKSHRFFRKLDWKALSRREVAAPIQPIITDPAEAENFDKVFTSMAMSPVAENNFGAREMFDAARSPRGDDPFGGFSFVASRSLLECD